MAEYRISELAEKAGVTKRTIHYYVNRGLLPPPEGAGVASTYNEGHLLRIRLIKKLQEGFLPLDTIGEMLSYMTDSEIQKKLDELGYPGLKLEERAEIYAAKERASPIGMEYIHIGIGKGIELTCPKKVIIEEEGTVKSIVDYARKLLKEK